MRRLVLLFDGTWNDERHPDAATNIVRLWELIAHGSREAKDRNESVDQRIFYDEGVGTGYLDRLTGGFFGSGLSEKVCHGYRFLSQFYEAGDEIYIFGFSRGAFTARSLAGFVAASVLLREEECNRDNLAFAWKYYRTPPKERFPADRATLQNNLGNRFHDTKLGSAIDFAFHAQSPLRHLTSQARCLFFCSNSGT